MLANTMLICCYGKLSIAGLFTRTPDGRQPDGGPFHERTMDQIQISQENNSTE